MSSSVRSLHRARALRPASVIRIRVTVISRPNAPTLCLAAVASPPSTSSAMSLAVKPCASSIVSVAPPGEPASNVSAGRVLRSKVGIASNSMAAPGRAGEAREALSGASFGGLPSGCRRSASARGNGRRRGCAQSPTLCSEQLGQPHDVDRDPPRLVTREPLRHLAAALCGARHDAMLII
jgi:hypothetical protein